MQLLEQQNRNEISSKSPMDLIFSQSREICRNCLFFPLSEIQGQWRGWAHPQLAVQRELFKPQEISCNTLKICVILSDIWVYICLVCSISFDLEWQFSVYNLNGRWITAVFTVKNLNVFTAGFSCSSLLLLIAKVLRLYKATLLCSLQTWDDSVSPWWFIWVFQIGVVKSRRGSYPAVFRKRWEQTTGESKWAFPTDRSAGRILTHSLLLSLVHTYHPICCSGKE